MRRHLPMLGLALTMGALPAQANLFEMLFGGGNQSNRPNPNQVNQAPRPQRPAAQPNSGSQPVPAATIGRKTPYFIAGGVPWVIRKNTWDEQDEKNYSDFITSLYESGCRTVPSCMAGSGNPYRNKDPKGTVWYADCGRFPYLTRAYFAFHNGLPFEAGVTATKLDPSDTSETKYSKMGNQISNRWSVTSGTNGYATIRNIVGAVFSQVYRVNSEIDVNTGRYGDFYHVRLDRRFVRPGTVIYDPNGHIAMVGEVKPNGKLILLDSHPDNSVTRVEYSAAFIGRSKGQGGGLKNWRTVTYDPVKKITSASSNANSPGFSMEQIVGDQPNPTGRFSTAKWSTSEGILPASQYMDVVRARLSKGAVKYRPVAEIKDTMNSLCIAMDDRVHSVKEAISKGIHLKSMPGGRLPENIYGTSGEWEDYSTPSRDARLKTSVNEFYTHIQRMWSLYQKRDPKVVYEGTDLAGDMLQAFVSASQACPVRYKNSNGQEVTISLETALRRLYAMSFDPYHCIELRMGASSNEEVASCQMSETKHQWYRAQQNLRNSLERGYDVRMFWSLTDLQNGADLKAKAGTTVQQPVDIGSLLRSLR